jgi:hypothetical protein
MIPPLSLDPTAPLPFCIATLAGYTRRQPPYSVVP